jgi:hypothetical protein
MCVETTDFWSRGMILMLLSSCFALEASSHWCVVCVIVSVRIRAAALDTIWTTAAAFALPTSCYCNIFTSPETDQVYEFMRTKHLFVLLSHMPQIGAFCPLVHITSVQSIYLWRGSLYVYARGFSVDGQMTKFALEEWADVTHAK